MKRALVAMAMVLTLGAAPAPAPSATPVPANTFADGATYVIEVPSNWNGTLLLYSHGYRVPGERNPATDAGNEIADLRPVLLARGYALAGSSYATTGYDVADALRDQMETLDRFVERDGRPKHTIAWGHSMGGLISVGLVEKHPDRFDAAMSMCGVLAGSSAAWNQLLDSEFIFKTLTNPIESKLEPANIGDPAANLQEAQRLFKLAAATQQGRARLTLAAAFGEEPGWDQTTADPPPLDDTNGRISAMIENFRSQSIPFGFFLRKELEERSGGNPSTNANESYLTAFRSLPQRTLIVTAYKDAGLDLEADLRALDASPRITAEPAAAAYLKENVNVGNTLPVPVLTMHTVADGLVPVENERSYADAVPVEVRASHLRQLFVKRSGHCAFTSAETLVALQSLIERMRNGSWSNLDPEDLNESAREYGDALNSFVSDDDNESPPVAPSFIEYVPREFMR